MSKAYFPGMNKWDSINSTYKHKIILKNGKELTGYSKGLLHSEMQDKIVLLQRMILRLYNTGYFDPSRVIRIEYYKKSLLHDDELILILSPDQFQYGRNEEFIMIESLNQFLTKFYKQIKEGIVITKDLKQKAKVKPEADIFSLNFRRFNNEMELISFITDKSREGFPKGLVLDFFHKYKEKYLSY